MIHFKSHSEFTYWPKIMSEKDKSKICNEPKFFFLTIEAEWCHHFSFFQHRKKHSWHKLPNDRAKTYEQLLGHSVKGHVAQH